MTVSQSTANPHKRAAAAAAARTPSNGRTATAADLSAALSDSASGDIAGDPSGEAVGGAGGESGIGEGAFAPGAGASTAGDGDGLREAGPGAGDGAPPNSSVGKRMLSTVKTHTGVSSRTVSAIREVPMPVSRVTSSP